MAKKKSHGGSREGAGRKHANPEGPTGSLTVTVPKELLAQLDTLRETRGWNKSQAVTEAIRQFIDTLDP